MVPESSQYYHVYDVRYANIVYGYYYVELYDWCYCWYLLQSNRDPALVCILKPSTAQLGVLCIEEIFLLLGAVQNNCVHPNKRGGKYNWFRAEWGAGRRDHGSEDSKQNWYE